MTEDWGRYERNAEDAEQSARLAATAKERIAYLAIAEVWREFAAKVREPLDYAGGGRSAS